MELFSPLMRSVGSALPLRTIDGARRALLSGELSCEQLVHSLLSQIDADETELRAWVSVDRDAALLTAKERDRELQAGMLRGPLHGIPVGVKDIIDIAGQRTMAGSALLANAPVATDDAELVRRLRQAGAVILGKTVTTQFACFDPAITRNPWNSERTPGGSSSGSAAAVAAGMCLAAIGSQTGGSITRPASFCGIASCKPTFGRISRRGVVPVSEHLDHVGPLANTVADLAVMMDVLCGFDSQDPYSAHGLGTETGSEMQLAAAISAPFSRPPRLGRVRQFFDPLVETTANESLEMASAEWGKAGASIVEPTLPPAFADVIKHHWTVMAVEAATFHETRFAEHAEQYSPGIRRLIEDGLATPITDYVRSRQHQTELSQQILSTFTDENVDVLICPATIRPAPDRATTGDPICNSPWSYTGLPTVSIPIAMTDNQLPLSVQLVGKPFGEEQLFQTAHWCEKKLFAAVCSEDGCA